MQEAEWRTGYVHVYTGDGKGKTTAALGLALRAAGAGLSVFIGQFIKGLHSSELETLERHSDRITLRQFGRDCFIRGNPARSDILAVRNGLEVIREIFRESSHHVVILDEVNLTVQCGLVSVGELLAVVDAKPPRIELVLTGRNAPPEIIERADLVTEMHEVKHYYRDGVPARLGIEN
jgi:cob(I)alamin adenosyltransferase